MKTSTIQNFNNLTIQLINISTIQQFNNSKIQQFKHSSIQHFNNLTIQHFNSSTLQQFNKSTIFGMCYAHFAIDNYCIELLKLTTFECTIMPTFVCITSDTVVNYYKRYFVCALLHIKQAYCNLNHSEFVIHFDNFCMLYCNV